MSRGRAKYVEVRTNRNAAKFLSMPETYELVLSKAAKVQFETGTKWQSQIYLQTIPTETSKPLICGSNETLVFCFISL